jgi:hypothetical protein
MASGFFGVTGAWHFALGLKAWPHQGVEGLVVDLHAMGLCHPLAQRLRRGKAFGLAEGLLQAGEHGRHEGDQFARRDVCGQLRLQPPQQHRAPTRG